MRLFFASAATLVTDHVDHGEGLIAWNVLQGLARRGHDVVACADAFALHAQPDFEPVALGRKRLESIGPYTRPRAIEAEFVKRGGANAYDAIHWLFPQQEEEVRLPRALGACRGVIGPLPKPWPGSDRQTGLRPGDLVRFPLTPLLRRRYQRELARADHLIASLPEVADALPAALRGKTSVAAFGIDSAPGEPPPLPTVPTIAFFGRLIPSKRVVELYEAFRAHRRRVPGARLRIYGSGPLEPVLRHAVARDQLEDRVAVHAALDHADVEAAMRDASLICLPSIGEPFGMVLLEAMAVGRAVVAVNTSGPRWIVADGRGGELIDPAELHALGPRMFDLLADPDRLAAYGRHNLEDVRTRHSWDAVLATYERAYRPVEGLPTPT
jgi:glycosyltransferase involved in cell wall biosynthesis